MRIGPLAATGIAPSDVEMRLAIGHGQLDADRVRRAFGDSDYFAENSPTPALARAAAPPRHPG
jgi:hypothetical protein